MGARSRRKGVGFEREVAQRFRESGIPADRTLTETRDGNVGDLTFPDGLPLVVQARCGAEPSPWRALRDAVAAAGPGLHPVGILRRNQRAGRPKVDAAILPLDDFLEMVEGLRESGRWR